MAYDWSFLEEISLDITKKVMDLGYLLISRHRMRNWLVSKIKGAIVNYSKHKGGKIFFFPKIKMHLHEFLEPNCVECLCNSCVMVPSLTGFTLLL